MLPHEFRRVPSAIPSYQGLPTAPPPGPFLGAWGSTASPPAPLRRGNGSGEAVESLRPTVLLSSDPHIRRPVASSYSRCAGRNRPDPNRLWPRPRVTRRYSLLVLLTLLSSGSPPKSPATHQSAYDGWRRASFKSSPSEVATPIVRARAPRRTNAHDFKETNNG